jgi:hypothetical protein
MSWGKKPVINRRQPEASIVIINTKEKNTMKKKSILILLTVIFSSCAMAQEARVFPIKMFRNKTLVSIKIGNVVIPDILLDTGLPYDGVIIYNPDYSDSLDLTNAFEVNIGGAGSGNASRALMIDSAEFFLGNTKMKNQGIIMMQSDIYKGFPSNGIIGYSIFGHYKTKIDYDNNTMTLLDTEIVKTDSSWTEIPLYFKDNNIPWIDAFVVIENEAPVPVSMYIDYADNDAIVLLEKPSMKFSLPEKTEKVLLGTGLSGDIYGKTGLISKLIIGTYELDSVKASIALAEVRSKQKNADAILGSGSLKRFNLIFDYENQKLYIKPNTHFNDPF